MCLLLFGGIQHYYLYIISGNCVKWFLAEYTPMSVSLRHPPFCVCVLKYLVFLKKKKTVCSLLRRESWFKFSCPNVVSIKLSKKKKK